MATFHITTTRQNCSSHKPQPHAAPSNTPNFTHKMTRRVHGDTSSPKTHSLTHSSHSHRQTNHFIFIIFISFPSHNDRNGKKLPCKFLVSIHSHVNERYPSFLTFARHPSHVYPIGDA